jgi:hypothetical protein
VFFPIRAIREIRGSFRFSAQVRETALLGTPICREPFPASRATRVFAAAPHARDACRLKPSTLLPPTPPRNLPRGFLDS